MLAGLILYIIIMYAGMSDFWGDAKPSPSYSWAIILVGDFLLVLPAAAMLVIEQRMK